MKKIVSSIILGTTILATTASADLTRVEAGAGMWSYKPTGTITYTDHDGSLVDTSLEKPQSSGYLWIFVKHPIPLVPNLRLEYSSIHDDGEAKGAYDGYTFPAGTDTTLDMTEFDLIPYYNLLDNTFWATVEAGLDFKIVQSDFVAKNAEISVTRSGVVRKDYETKSSAVIPLAYVRGRVEIPSTDIGLEADAKYISYDGDTVYDIRAKIDYTLSFLPVIQPALEFGYRKQRYDITSDDKKTKIDLTFSGLYVGVFTRF